MIEFRKKIDKRSRKKMIEFLTDHFRYDTMNGWNVATSYANNLKIYRLGLTREQEERLFDLLDCEESYDAVNDLIHEFDKSHDYKWQARFNGRSGGYLVLCQGGSKPSEHKSFCTFCGQRNFTSVKETGCKCGVCGNETRVDFIKPPLQTFVHPGKGTDMNEDFEDWSMDDLRARVKLVQEFDKLCDSIVEEAINLIENYEIEEEEVFVPKTVKKLVAVG